MENWDDIFIDACITQSILIVLYLVTLTRMRYTARLTFVIVLVVLLTISCITWIIVAHYAYQYAKVKNLDLSCNMQSGLAKSYCVRYFIYNAINVISFNIACWIFAARYWIFSHLLKLTLN